MYWLTEGQAPVDAKVGLALLEFPEVCSFFFSVSWDYLPFKCGVSRW